MKNDLVEIPSEATLPQGFSSTIRRSRNLFSQSLEKSSSSLVVIKTENKMNILYIQEKILLYYFLQ